MSGLYVHIPFCRTKCGYCNFFSLATTGRRDDFIKALCREASWYARHEDFPVLDTIYLGGGTPSLLDQAQLLTLFEALRLHFRIEPGAEITLECNPDDMDKGRLPGWREMGINRLSIGVQSFISRDLAYLDRVHDTDQASRAIDRALDAGFENLSIDLIYGIPGQSLQDWDANLNRLVDLEIPHISAYALTIEDKTILKSRIDKGIRTAPDEENMTQHFLHMHEKLRDSGYEHYEISNLAKPGKEARHNRAYWDGVPYLGLGPSAHSYNGIKRWWNKSNLSTYIRASSELEVRENEEILSDIDRYNEYIMTGLRTARGCRTDHLAILSSAEVVDVFEQKALAWESSAHMKKALDTWLLTPTGMLLADGIAASFFL